jgi:Polyketide cyclase / dehydrase and lipid transport
VEVRLNKLKLKQSIYIELPSYEIFAYLSALENQVTWSSVTTAVRQFSPGTTHVGTRLSSSICFLGRRFDITFEIVECEPHRCLTLKSTAGVSPCLFSYQLEPLDDGRTNLSCEALIHFTAGVMAQRESVLVSAARRQLSFDLQTLKDVLEDRALV